MRPPSRRLIRRSHAAWLRHVAFVLALLAQAMGALSTVSEGRGGVGAGPHIDGAGTKSHYVHDEANCIACHVRSVHSRTTTAARFERIVPTADAPIGRPRTAPVLAEPVLLNQSRAPPEGI